jgi:hypothetical protein
MLVILIVCAFISIGLSFYHPPEEKLNEDELIEKEGLLVLAFVFNIFNINYY